MSTLLQINASILGEQGQSSQLAARFVAAWKERNPGGQVVQRDLAAEPVPHLSAAGFAAVNTPLAQRDAAQSVVAEYSEALIEQIRRADVLVLGLPMYNFGIPSQLKAYFDHIARAGLTFSYTAAGPVGLLQGKRAYVFDERGGLYVDPFLMLDEFYSDDPRDYLAGFPSHPHRGFETVTYMLDGHMRHEDHLGNRGDLGPGDVQWMTAAGGIIHSEMPQQSQGRMRGFQLWLNLPADEKMKPAHYRDIPAGRLSHS